jgi:dihydropyrimidinase
VSEAYDLVLKNGLLIPGFGEPFVGDLAIAGERIAAVGQGLRASRAIDASGMYVIPGAVDGHVHLTDPTFPPFALPTADSFATATVAAAHGGTTTLIDFAQPAPGQPLLAEFARRRSDAEGQATVDYGLHLNLRDPDPARLDELPAVFAQGAPSLKLYMAYEGYRLPDDAILRAMQAVARLGGLAIVHAENASVIDELQRQYAAEGKLGPRFHAATRPAVAEAEAVHRALALAALAACRTLIFHISCDEAVRELRLARARGVPAYGETCAHYLALTDARLADDGFAAQSLAVMPPIRGRDQQDALWRALAAGDLDIVSTDHCPRQPLADRHPPGVSGVEPRLALVHSLGVGRGLISLGRWVQLCCAAPARLFGLASKGSLAPGMDADVVVFDPSRRLTLAPATLHSPLGFSSFDGIEVSGWPALTIARGQVVVEEGRFVGEPGRGRYLHRSYA